MQATITAPTVSYDFSSYLGSGAEPPSGSLQEPHAIDRFENGYIAMGSKSFINPVDQHQPAQGWFQAVVGKAIIPRVPIITDSRFYFLSKNTQLEIDSPEVNIPLEISELTPVHTALKHVSPEEIYYSDEAEFFTDGKILRTQIMGSVFFERILKAGNLKSSIYLSPLYTYATIEQINIVQFAQDNDPAIEIAKEKTGVFLSTKPLSISKQRMGGHNWAGTYKPNSPDTTLPHSPDDFFNINIGGGAFGGFFAPSFGTTDTANVLKFSRNQRNCELIRNLIPTGQEIEIELKNSDLSTAHFAETHVMIEIAYHLEK